MLSRVPYIDLIPTRFCTDRPQLVDTCSVTRWALRQIGIGEPGRGPFESRPIFEHERAARIVARTGERHERRIERLHVGRAGHPSWSVMIDGHSLLRPCVGTALILIGPAGSRPAGALLALADSSRDGGTGGSQCPVVGAEVIRTGGPLLGLFAPVGPQPCGGDGGLAWGWATNGLATGRRER